MIKKADRKSKTMKVFVVIMIIILAVCAWLFFTAMRKNNTDINLNELSSDTVTLSCAVFDGKEVWEDSTVVIKDGMITEETSLKKGETDSEYFLMPGLIDAHAHLTKPYQMEQLVENGITTVCDVSASEELQSSYNALNVWSSRTSVWLDVDDVTAFVKNTISQNGKYIKVVADLPQIMGGGIMEKSVLEEIVKCAHENSLKVAVHAISVAGVQMAVDCGIDLLIHIPIGENFPQSLAEQIAENNIAVMPTLAMMQAFANSKLYGYEQADYNDAKEAVQLLHSLNAPILVATDSSDSFFVPQLKHGETLHEEMALLVDAGLSESEVLQGATTKTAEAFGIENVGTLTVGMKATMVLVKGRPDRNITDSTEIIQIWVNGKPILKNTDYPSEAPNETGSNAKETKITLIKAGENDMNTNELIFYPKHPSNLKTHKIETKAMPILEQSEPFDAKALSKEFCDDLNGALEIYEDKRFEVTGIASKIGPDIHNKPSIEISDEVGGQCYTLCIFPTDDFYDKVSVGDRVTVRANYLVMSNLYGVVMKYSELVNAD